MTSTKRPLGRRAVRGRPTARNRPRTGPSTFEANPDEGPAPAAPDDLTTVEVAHEALIREWDRLRGWIKDDRAFLHWRQRLGFQIAEWERSCRDKGALLRGTLLKETRRFARSRRDDLNDREREFLASESQSRRWLLEIGVITILAILGGIEFYRYERALALFEEIQTAEIRRRTTSRQGVDALS